MTLVACMSGVTVDAARSGAVIGSVGWGGSGISGSTSGSGIRGNRTCQSLAGSSGMFWDLGRAPGISNGDSVIFGCAHTMPGSGGFMSFRAAGGANIIFQLVRNSTGTVSVQNTSGSTLGTGTAAVYPTTGLSTFYYTEVKFTWTNFTTYSVEVSVNGTVAVTITSGAFGSYLSNTIQRVDFFAQGSAMLTMDYYWLNSQGSVNNNYLGDSRVEALLPTSEGANTAWSLGAGSSKTAAVTLLDGNTSYVSTSAASQRQTFVMSDLANTLGTVRAVCATQIGRSESSTAKLSGVVRSGGTSYDSANYRSVGTGVYDFAMGIFETNPATGSAWTAAEVNAMEAGMVVLP